MTIRVVLADDQALCLGTLRQLIDSCDGMEIIAVAGRRGRSRRGGTGHPPRRDRDGHPYAGLDGLAATAEICRDETLRDTKVLILTTIEADEYVAQALRAGASGFLGKDVESGAFLDAIRTVAAGDALLFPSAARSLISDFLARPARGRSGSAAAVLEVLTARERKSRPTWRPASPTTKSPHSSTSAR